MTLTINYFDAARASTGLGTEQIDYEAIAAEHDGRVTRGAVENALAQRHGEAPAGEQPLLEVLGRCSFLLDGQACPDPQETVPDGATIDIVPPGPSE